MSVQPIDKSRCGRLVIASLDNDKQRASAIVEEAIRENRFPELFDATTGLLGGLLRLAIGADNLRQAASDWVLAAQLEDQQGHT